MKGLLICSRRTSLIKLSIARLRTCMSVCCCSRCSVGYTSPNAKLENDLHIVQRHMVKMQSLIVKRNRRGNIPENKQRVRMKLRIYEQELDDEDDFLSQCLIRLLEVTRCFDTCRRKERRLNVVSIPETTRDLCRLLKNSLVQLLQANKDPSIDASKIQIYPEDMRRVEESDESEESEEDFFKWYVCQESNRWHWELVLSFTDQRR